MTPDPEAAILGALIAGALAPPDLAELPVDAFARDTHAAALPHLLAVARTSRKPSIAACVEACGVVRLARPGGLFVLGPGFWSPYLRGLAQRAPRRRAALSAIDAARVAWHRREDVARDRAALSLALADVVTGAGLAWLRMVREDGGILCGDVLRPIEGEAIGEGADVRWMIAAALRVADDRDWARAEARRLSEAGAWERDAAP